MLRPLPDQKSLVYFASGLRLNGVDNQAQLRATTNAALRANVSIFPVDARGLVADAPLGDATRPSPGGIGDVHRPAGRPADRTVPAVAGHAVLRSRKDTGGKAMFDYNDLSLGIVQAARRGHELLHPRLLQHAHRARRQVPPREGRRSTAAVRPNAISYRQGYFADKEFAKFTEADKERQLEEALMLDNPVTDITIAMEVNYFQLNRAEYFVPVAVKIPGSELALARAARRAAHADRLHRRGEGRLRHHDSERSRQARHQAERRNRGAARASGRFSTRRASRCCPAST